MPVGGLLDRFAVGLGGLGAGMQGQPNPVLGQRMQVQQMQQTQQYQQAQMQDAALRRQLELKRLEGDVQQRRLDQARTQLTIAGHMANSRDRTTRHLGYDIMGQVAPALGLKLDPSILKGLGSADIEPSEVEGASRMIVRGVDPKVIQATYQWATPQIQQGLVGPGGIEPLAAHFGVKSPSKLKTEAAIAERDEQKAIKEGKFPELTGPMAQFIQAQHKLKNHGQLYTEGDEKTQQQALLDGEAAYNKSLSYKASATQGEIIEKPPAGGAYYDEGTHQMVYKAITRGELESGRYHSITAAEKQRSDFAGMALNSAAGLKELLPKVLATQPVANLVKALQMEVVTGPLAMSPDLVQFHDQVLKLDIELGRVLGGSGVVRRFMLEAIRKSAGTKVTDTVATAMRRLDNNMIDMVNTSRQIFRDPAVPQMPTTGEKRIGPGAYWAEVVDEAKVPPTLRGKVKAGDKVPIKLRPLEESGDWYKVVGER